MGQLLVPAMIGAGVGAVGGAATGKNPFKTALLGAAVGAGGAGLMGGAGAAAGTAGTGAGAGLIGGANLSTAGGVGVGSGFGSGLFSGLQGVATTPVSMGTGGFASGIGGQVIPNVTANVAPVIETAAQTASQNFIPQNLVGNATGSNVSNFVENTPFMPNANLTNTIKSAPDFTPVLGRSAGYTGGGQGSGGFFGGIQDMIGNPFTDLTSRDKLNLGLQGIGMLNQPQQQIQQTPVTPITRGNPEMVSTPLFNVAPNVGRQEGNDIGLPNLLSKMPLTEEEILRLQQEMQTTRFRGR